AAGSRQARLRMLRVSDEGAVEIPVLIDLRGAHEAYVHVTSLQQQQDLGAAQNHIGAPRAALIIGRGWKLTGLDERADDPAFEKNGQAGAAQPLRQGRRQERNADPGKYHLPVLELARTQD